MSVIRAAEAPRFQLPGVEFTGLAAPSRGSAELCTWRLTVDAGLEGKESHALDRDEVFMVLSGTIQVTPDGEKLGVGDAIVVPAGEPIQLSNLGDTSAEVYVAITAGFTATMPDGTTVTPPWAR